MNTKTSIKTTQLNGDVALGRNLSVGGEADVSGSIHVGHNLKVDGWLDAPNLRGACKGYFRDGAALLQAYPHPEAGWWCVVGDSWDSGEIWWAQWNESTAKVIWNRNAGSAPPAIAVNIEEYEEDLRQLRGDMTELRADTERYRQVGQDLAEAMYESVTTELEEAAEVEGRYIGRDGSLQSFENYRLRYYVLEPGARVRIERSNAFDHDTATLDYALYDCGDISQAGVDTLIDRGEQVKAGAPASGHVDITAPAVCMSGRVLLVLTQYTTLLRQNAGKVETRVVDIRRHLAAGRTAWALDGDTQTLSTAWLDGDGREYVSVWRRCMANDLYTFWLLGWREVSRGYPSVEGVSTLEGVHVINRTGSDNIGPMCVGPEGQTNYWTGGNHLYGNGVKTARTETVRIWADGVAVAGIAGDGAAGHSRLAQGAVAGTSAGYAQTLRVEVENFIGDPFGGDDGTILSTRLSRERVVYSLSRNNIEVEVSQELDRRERIGCYYGMQSMMEGESKILTPNGAYADWTDAENTMSFSVGDYPRFCRFVEKSDEGLQECWLWPEGAGDHHYLQDYNTEFSRNGDKSYHQVLRGVTVNAGESIRWRGTYTWMRSADYEDSELVCYRSRRNGKQVYVVVAKRYFSGAVPMPADTVFDVDLDTQTVTLNVGEEVVLGENIGDKLKSMASKSDLEQMQSTLPGTYIRRTEVSNSLADDSTTNVASAWSVNAVMNAVGTISTQLSDRISALEGNHVALTEAEYEALAEKDENTIYLIYEDDTL